MIASLDWLTTSGAEFDPLVARSGCAHLKYYSVDYREWGSGPPLVLVPGLAGGMGLLSPLAQILSRDFRVISYQLRGEDDCFALRRRFGLKDLVDDLAEFLEWHCLEAPAVFGVSFGGLLALELAARYPHRLSRLVVQGVGGRFESSLLQRVASVVLSRYPLPADNPFVNQFFNLLFGKRQRPGPLFQFVTRQCWQTDQSIIAHRFKMVERFSMEGRLGRVRVPTLVMTGDRDLLVSESSLDLLRRGIANCQLVRLKGAGHFACVSEPGRLAEEVKHFISDHA